MSSAPRTTLIRRPFAGQDRSFQLRLGEISALEAACAAGIGEIALRINMHTFKAADVWETVRLGLEGGGMKEPQATRLVMNYHDGPLSDYLGLAAEIISAALHGAAPQDDAPGKDEAEGSTSPGTSPPCTTSAG